MSSSAPGQGPSQPPRGGNKRKASAEYSENPNTVKTRKRISHMTEAQKVVHTRQIAMNTRLSREMKKLRATSSFKSAPSADQQKQEQELRQRNEEYYMQKGTHPSQFDAQASSSSQDDTAMFDDVSDTEMGISDEELAIDFVDDGVSDDEDATILPTQTRTMQEIAHDYLSQVQKQTLVISYTKFRATWLATLEILWAKLSTFYRFPTQVDRVLRPHEILEGTKKLPLAQNFLTTEEIFLCGVLHFFWDPTAAKDNTKSLGQFVIKANRRRDKTFKRSTFWTHPTGLMLYTKRKGCYSWSIPVRKMIRDILCTFEETDNQGWMTLPGPAGIWRQSHKISDKDYEILDILFNQYGNQLGLIAEYLEMPPMKDHFPSSWKTFDPTLLNQVFKFKHFEKF